MDKPLKQRIVTAIYKDMVGHSVLGPALAEIDTNVLDRLEIGWQNLVERELAEQVGTFGWAVAKRRPMRRAAWLKHPPQPAKTEDFVRELVEHTWVYLRPLVEHATEARWIWLTTGKPINLNFQDYNASDWEVL